MADTIRDLEEWYPILPGAAADKSIAKSILDIRLILPMPTLSPGAEVGGRLDQNEVPIDPEDYGIHIIEIDGATVYFRIDAVDMELYFSLTACIGRDASPLDDYNSGDPETNGGYIVMSTDEIHWSGDLKVHPNCMIVFPALPDIEFSVRPSSYISVCDGASLEDGGVEDCYTGPKTFIRYSQWGSLIPFISGNNVSVSWSGGTVYMNGRAGGGIGYYEKPPFFDAKEIDPAGPSGLRSINGIYDNVTISGGSPIEVSTSSDNVITIKVKQKDNA